MRSIRILCLLLLVFFAVSCAAGIGTPREKILPALVLIPSDKVPPLADDLDNDLLATAVDRSLQYYEKIPANNMQYIGDERITAKVLKESLLAFQEILSGSESDEVKREKIRNTFDLYRATGLDSQSTVLFTGYFESVLNGSLEKTDEYRYPIYKTPDDIVVVNL